MEWIDAERDVRVGDTMKKVWDAKFYDQTGSITLAVWDSLIKHIDQKIRFRCKNVTTNYWNGQLKLTTTTTSTIERVEPDIAMKPLNASELSNDKITVLCCPEIIAAQLQEYYSCRNIVCRRK